MKKLYVQEIIDYIEQNIEEDITIDDISAYIGYSKFYLNKVFRIFTGMSIMYYTRKRKLEYAMIDLQSTMPIIDIAFKYGFNHRRSFTRVFTSFYKESPSNLRNNTYKLSNKIVLEEIGGIIMLPYLSELKETTIEQLYVLSKTVISSNPEDEVIKLQTDYKQKHNLTTIREFGLDSPIPEDQQDQNIRGYEYWLCISKEDFENHETTESKKLIIPSSKYLMLTIEDPFANPFERIPNGWKKLVSQLEGKYKVNEELCRWGLEEVIEVDNKTAMHIYLPIQ